MSDNLVMLGVAVLYVGVGMLSVLLIGAVLWLAA